MQKKRKKVRNLSLFTKNTNENNGNKKFFL